MVGLNYLLVEEKQQLEIFMVRQFICSIELHEKRHLLCLIHTIILFWFLKNKIAAVILPSLQRIHNDFVELDSKDDNHGLQSISKKRLQGGSGLTNIDTERDDECGICLEPCTKMVLPNCCHAMCINCYRNW